MTLSPGARVGPYEIASVIGAGGMGEVYRATDTVLNRAVALKVLPDAFAADPERVARFKREAQVLASLNHPNIAQIHGFETTGPVSALVMELVEGPTLADRIARGALPLDEALPIAQQIAEALEAAHQQGIIHRDLKPANIKIREDGTVKVLDFGLAKAFEPVGDRTADVTTSPTITSPAMTQMGVILGTAAYMSPEQAAGQPVDKRTDIWAFGVVLWEMLTGRRLFDGESVLHTLADVLRAAIAFDSLPTGTPPAVHRLLRHCLVRDPKRRLRDIGDAGFEIDGARIENAQAQTRNADGASGTLAHATGRERVAWLLVVLLVAAVIGALVVPRTPQDAANLGVTRTIIALPAEEELDRDLRAAPLAVSPDGSRIVYVVDGDGRKQLYQRALSELNAVRISGTVGAAQPFFSPDGAWVAFFARGMLQRVAVSGGAPVPVCPVSGVSMGGTWGPGDVIVFATLDGGLFKVAASGGTPVRLQGTDGVVAVWPEILPDGRTVLFVASESGGDTLATLPLDGGVRRMVARPEASANGPAAAVFKAAQLGPVRYVPSGHLIFGQGASQVSAIAFDASTLVLTGSPVSIVDAVFRSADGGGLYFAVSRTGVLLYAPEDVRRRLVWVDRSGRSTPIGSDQEAFRYPSISPDEKRIAVDINTPERRSDIWIMDVERGTKTRLTADRSSILPVWERDNMHLTYGARRDIASVASDGSGTPLVLETDRRSSLYPTSWSPDGRELLTTVDDAKTGMDLWVVPRDAAAKPRALLVRPFHDAWAKFSPDGHWVAYLSDESGTNEVYVAHYPDMASRVLVSTHGASWAPVWSPDGRELFYRQGNAVMAVGFQTTPVARVGKPQMLFAGSYAGVDGDRIFDVSHDGRRFLMIERVDTAVARQLVVVQRWFDELKRLVPVK